MIQRLINKALKSPCTYKIAAASFDKKGTLLHTATNLPGNDTHRGLHAEEYVLIKSGVSRVASIIIVRVNSRGCLLPIDACESCLNLCRKYGIWLESLKP